MTPTGSPTLISDEALAEKIQHGDMGAFGDLVSRYSEKLIRYASRILKNSSDAEDVVQEVFIKAYQNINQFDASRKFSSWLYRIAHNECINLIRKSNKEAVPFFDPDEIFPHPIAKEAPETDAEKREIVNMINRSLKKLTVKYKDVLLLYYFEELSYEEIADVLHVPVNTVGVRLKRAKDALKKVIQQDAIYE